MTYKLGTTLIFNLTNASAAADLFGKDALTSHLYFYNDRPSQLPWSKKFNPQAVEWRLVLDTEEKLQWFVPQVWDEGYDEGYIEYTDGHKVQGIFMNEYTIEPYNIYHKITTQFFGKVKAVIERRQGKPFPTPQDAKEPDGGNNA